MNKAVLLFLIFLLGMGIMRVQAQDNSQSADLVLYQQAIKAIKEKKFVFKASLHDNGRRYQQVDPSRNYIILDNDLVTLSCYDIRGWSYEGKITKYKLRTDKKGNLHLDISVKAGYNSISKWDFCIEKGSNHCVVVRNPVRAEARFVFTGELFPYNTSGLYTPIIYNNEDRMKK